MDSTILAAIVGVPATLVTAAIAYPVGRGVARREAEDQHTQWLRTQRHSTSSQLADGGTEFIESAHTAYEFAGEFRFWLSLWDQSQIPVSKKGCG